MKNQYKKTKINSVLYALTLILVSAGISSCSAGNTAILLWSHNEESIASGSLVQVHSESAINNSVSIRFVDSDSVRQEAEIEAWRVEENFGGLSASEVAEAYQEYAPYYAVSEIQALPVRREASTGATSPIIYRLSEGERVKVLWQSPERVDVGALNDYWFEVLTRDGTRGFVYGHRLEKQRADGTVAEERVVVRDPVLANVLATRWRPEYFQIMIDNNRFNLNTFEPQYQFYHDEDPERFVLNSPDHRIEFEYSEIIRPRYAEYQALGTSLLLIVYSDDRILVQYDFNGQAIARTFTRVREDINAIIASERERRSALLQRLLMLGNRLQSSGFGSIALAQDGSAVWESYQALLRRGVVPELPTWFSGGFNIDFPLYLSETLSERYDGAISFTTSGQGIQTSLNFLYRIQERSVQLEYISPANIDGFTVERQSRSPVGLRFRIVN